jgi:hypothetical protein
MTMRTRLAIIATLGLLALGAGAEVSANAATPTPQTDTNACVVVRPIQVAVCIPRF